MIREANKPGPVTAGAGHFRIARQVASQSPARRRAEIAIAAAISAEPLTDDERRELGEAEEKIAHGARAWFDMGIALTGIREKRLYRETHKTLEAYCWEKFRLERSVVYRLIAIIKQYQVIMPIAQKLRIQFTAESQFRPLAKCQPGELADVLKLTAKKIAPDPDGNRIPTAKILAGVVRELNEQTFPGERPDKPEGAAAAKAPAPAAIAVRTGDSTEAPKFRSHDHGLTECVAELFTELVDQAERIADGKNVNPLDSEDYSWTVEDVLWTALRNGLDEMEERIKPMVKRRQLPTRGTI